MPDTPPKTMGILEQVRRKVSKEQNTCVQIDGDGPVELKMRVFVANSVEAKAVGKRSFVRVIFRLSSAYFPRALDVLGAGRQCATQHVNLPTRSQNRKMCAHFL